MRSAIALFFCLCLFFSVIAHGETGRSFALVDGTSRISNGVPVPESSDFPMQKMYYFYVGPRVEMTAAHVYMCWEGSGGICGSCPADRTHPSWKGVPFVDKNGSIVVIGSGYCLAEASDWDGRGSNFGWDSDWALIIRDAPLPINTFLTLDFNPLKVDEEVVIIGMGYGDVTGGVRAAALYKAVAVDKDSAKLESYVTGRITWPGDSGSPWLRVYPDGKVGVIGAHSTGDRVKFSGTGLFQSARDVEVIKNFVSQYPQAEICGVNLECASVELPVSMDDLRRHW